jgi:DNA-3-methyladenine glycosylase II
MSTIRIFRPRAFSLKAATEFFGGFVPGSGMAAAATDRLTLTFRLDGTFDAVAIELLEDGDALVGKCAGTTDTSAVVRQVSRILGLDRDVEAWLALGERVPLVGRLQREFPGFLTAAKASPYDAAVWGVLAPRMPMVAAAKLKSAIARDHGDVVALAGRSYPVFPSPRVVLHLDRIDRLPDEKLMRLHAVARAALDGKLDAERLRSMGPARALAELQTLRGVGPWTASHIFFRGAAPHDELPTAEPRVLHGFAHICGIEVPSEEVFAHAARAWRPFRMWVCVLLARHLARTGGWSTPGLARERARAGRRLAKVPTAHATFATE